MDSALFWGKSSYEIPEIVGAKYPSEPIIKCINKFKRTDSVENIKQSGRPKSSTNND